MNGDNQAASSTELSSPDDVYLDSSGNIYIADSGNIVIRKITSNGISTIIAGTGILSANSLDGGMATSTRLNFPTGVVVDASNNIFFADSQNNKIKLITSAGIITTYAGTGQKGYGGDGGPATSALLYYPCGTALDPQGNLIVADYGNSIIRKIDKSTQIISIIAGTTSQGASGDYGAATSASLTFPSRVRFDTSGNLYIVDSFNNKVRFVLLSTGIITTFAGTGTAGSSGDGGQATSAQLCSPNAIALDLYGNRNI